MELQPDGTYTQAAEEAWDKPLLARLEHGGEPHAFGHEYTVPSVAYALPLLDYQAAALPSTARRQKLMRYVHQLVMQRVRALAAAWATDDPVERTAALRALQAASHWQPLLDERVPVGGTANAKIVLLEFLRTKALFAHLGSESWHTVLAAVLEVQPDTVARYLGTRDPASAHFIYGPKELGWARQVLEEAGLSTAQVVELDQVAARQVRRRPGK
ncbi:hypothetical protein EJV47_01445 [Hymenobacter gummosus]|uniref:Uncharacterized protein n=2 Tax=Hymenobacter gummosus TaxID=1776032 RepID=A0A431U9A2_9BACT|nr:hypothetical protein EJV47_01445 [Hymenobacter gummosus]